jgi:hypothetical protein
MLHIVARFVGPRPMIQLLGWRFIEERKDVRYLDYPSGESALFVQVEGLQKYRPNTPNSLCRKLAERHGLEFEAMVATASRHTQPFTLSSLTEVGDRHNNNNNNNNTILLSSDHITPTLTYKPTQTNYFSQGTTKIAYRAVLDTTDLMLARVARAHGLRDGHSYQCRNGVLTYLSLARATLRFLHREGFSYIRPFTFGLPNEPEFTIKDNQEAGQGTN